MSRSALLARPVSGTAWINMAEAAQHPGTPDLCNQDNDHHLRALAAALVYARTGAAAHGTKARSGVMAAPCLFLSRRIVFARNLADGAHSLVIKAQGTSGHPTVALDGIYLLSPG